jgi:hypothetical protein
MLFERAPCRIAVSILLRHWSVLEGFGRQLWVQAARV